MSTDIKSSLVKSETSLAIVGSPTSSVLSTALGARSKSASSGIRLDAVSSPRMSLPDQFSPAADSGLRSCRPL